jgi:hypothetical protein
MQDEMIGMRGAACVKESIVLEQNSIGLLQEIMELGPLTSLLLLAGKR